MADSIFNPDRKCLFRDDFSSEANTRRLGGVPTGVTYSNGEVSGSNKYIDCYKPIRGTYSCRIKITTWTINVSSHQYLFCALTGAPFIRIISNSSTIESATGTSIYINGIATTTLNTTGINEIVVSGIPYSCHKGFELFSWYTHSGSFTGSASLFEIYSGTLTANEVKSLYENKRYRTPNLETLGRKIILDVNAFSGVVRNRLSGNVINGVTVPSVVNTAISVVKENDRYVPRFNGSTSKITSTPYDTLVGDKTVISWVCLLKSTPIIEWSRIGVSDKFRIFISTDSTAKKIFVSSDEGSTHAVSAVNSFPYTKVPHLVIVTRTTTGVTNIYLDGILSGTANQSSGTPLATTEILLGLNNASSQGFNGLIPSTRIIDGILTPQEIMDLYTAEKSAYGL